MTPELTVLALAALLQILTLTGFAISANLQLGAGKTLGPRDPARLGAPLAEQVDVKTARLFRAFNNHFESLAIFTIACVIVSLSNQTSAFTTACAYIYLGARILYVPAYVFGLTPWRSVVWFIGILAPTAMLISALI